MAVFENYDDVVTVEQLAEMLKIGRNTAYQLINSGVISHLKIDRKIKIPKQIQEYLGHEKVSTTLDIYGHLSVEGKAAAAQTMDSLLEIC